MDPDTPIYIYMYIHICTCMYVCICIYMLYVYIYLYLYLHMCTYIYIHVYLFFMYTHTYVYIYICIIWNNMLCHSQRPIFGRYCIKFSGATTGWDHIDKRTPHLLQFSEDCGYFQTYTLLNPKTLKPKSLNVCSVRILHTIPHNPVPLDYRKSRAQPHEAKCWRSASWANPVGGSEGFRV